MLDKRAAQAYLPTIVLGRAPTRSYAYNNRRTNGQYQLRRRYPGGCDQAGVTTTEKAPRQPRPREPARPVLALPAHRPPPMRQEVSNVRDRKTSDDRTQAR